MTKKNTAKTLDELEVEKQAQGIMSRVVVALLRNIAERIPVTWGFGVIFFNHRLSGPVVWAASPGVPREKFIEVAERFVRQARQAKG